MSDPLALPFSEQLAPATQAILAQAETEARAFDQNSIGAEHLLLALLADQGNLGTHVLQTFGISYRRAHKATDFISRRQDQKADPPAEQPSRLTSCALAALTLARSEATGLHLPLITPELLLIGIIREGKGIGAGVLESLGADVEKVRAQVYAHLGSAGKASEANIPKGNVVTCRISDQDLAAIDALVESGVRTTRSEAAAWLIHAGLDANKVLLDVVYGTAAEIRRLRVIAQSLTHDATSSSPDEGA